MITFLALLAFLLAFTFFIFSKKTFSGNFYLAGFFTVLGIWGVMIQLMAFSHSEFWAPLFFIHVNPLLYLSGPLIYMYIITIVKQRNFILKKDFVHLILPLLVFVNVLPYYFTDFAFKQQVVATFRTSLHYPDLKNLNLLIPYRYTEIIRPLVLMVYSLASIILINKNKELFKSNHYVLGIPSSKMIIWMKIQLYVVVIYSLMYGVISLALSELLKIESFSSNVMPFGTFVKFLILFSMVAFFFVPSILYGIPHAQKLVKTSENQNPEEKLKLFNEQYIARIEKEVNNQIENEIYLREDLSVNSMSKLLNIPDHHLALYFNNVVEMKFSDWKNHYRVEYAKRKIQEGYLNDYSSENLAKTCGFSHQSTFFAVFKKFTGLTPGDYAKSILV